MQQENIIVLYQPVLHSIAVKMVGCVEDAEDIVQDTFLKWLTIDTSKVANTRAYLIKSVTNNCLNHLNAIKRKRDELLENLNPTELIEKYKEKEIFQFDAENEISAAWAIVHRKLGPVEKAVYILREVFNFEYDELQLLVDRKRDNCRQLFSRAREKLTCGPTRLTIDIQRHLKILDSFKKACVIGNITDLIGDLSIDIKEKLKGSE